MKWISLTPESYTRSMGLTICTVAPKYGYAVFIFEILHWDLASNSTKCYHRNLTFTKWMATRGTSSFIEVAYLKIVLNIIFQKYMTNLGKNADNLSALKLKNRSNSACFGIFLDNISQWCLRNRLHHHLSNLQAHIFSVHSTAPLTNLYFHGPLHRSEFGSLKCSSSF